MSEEVPYLSDEDVEAIVSMIDMLGGEEDAVAQAHSEHILDVIADAEERRKRGDDPVLEILRRAHQAQAEEDVQQ